MYREEIRESPFSILWRETWITTLERGDSPEVAAYYAERAIREYCKQFNIDLGDGDT